MIASCWERMRAGDCGGCEREDACTQLLRRLGLNPATMRMRPRTAAPRPDGGGLLAALFSEVVRNVVAKMAERPSSRPPGRFRQELEGRLEPLLAAGNVRMEAVARSMGLSRQTLYRRLREEGLTFEEVLEGLRRRLALRLLRKGSSVKEVAYRLGFADPAAFSRAFKRWTGRSPSEARGTSRDN